MSRQQIVVMVIMNAVISLLISLTVVLVFERYRSVPSDADTQAATSVAVSEAGGVAVATMTNTPVTVRAVATYVVQSGDNLSEIAYRHNVTLDALMKANGIEDADYINVGQSLIIPEGGSVIEPTSTPPYQQPTLVAVLTPEGGNAPVVIESFVTGSTAAEEYVVIANEGAKGIAMEGWTLEDGDGNVYTFPNLFLWRNGTVLVHTGIGENSATDLYWQLTEPVWSNPDETALLRNAEGDIVHERKVAGDSGSN